jgi:hypothetical protein
MYVNSSQDKPSPDVAEQLTPINLRRSLRSTCCPACAGVKEQGKSLCTACYARLPEFAAADLRAAVDDGYEGLLLRALRTLGVRTFRLPGDPACREVAP